MSYTIYLSGEIHTDWRERIQSTCREAGLEVSFTGPVLDHGKSDGCGEAILGPEESAFWRDHKAAKINAIRTRVEIQKSDLVVVRFGEKYKQWNAAFDAGYAAASAKPYVVIHDPQLTHALKEVDAAAFAVAESPDQVVELIRYVLDS